MLNLQKLFALEISCITLYQQWNIKKTKVKKKIPFKIAPKKYKINLTREMKDIYAENYKILIKENQDDFKN